MAHRLRSAAIAAGVLGVMALLIAGFLLGFEPQTRRVATGYGPEARENDYLAAGRLIRRLGVEIAFVSELTMLTDLPGHDGTVFIPVSRRAQSKDQSERLLDWVFGGGSLIVAAEAPEAKSIASPDYLLNTVGIGTAEIESESGTDGLVLISRRLTFDGKVKKALSVDLDTSFMLVDSANKAFLKSSRTRPRMLHMRYGKGVLTVLTGAEFMRNSRLAEADNAVFLWYLASGLDHAGPIQLVYGRAHDSLIGLVALRFRPILISLGLLIAFAVWSAAVRLGPVFAGAELERRSLIEHIDAGGYFLWRRGHARFLMDAVRLALRRSVTARHPSWSRLSEDQQRERLDAALGLTAGQRQALFGEVRVWKEKQFVKTISELERMRSSL